ncbi:MAG: ABC transporter ATP-binding protein [Spirochaetales bacterium]
MSDNTRQTAVSFTNISLSFGTLKALSSINCSIPATGVVGLLGPNGAGKTTLLRVLFGYLLPDSGSVRVCGIDLFEDPGGARANIGYMPERASAYEELTVDEHLHFLADAYGLSRRERSSAVARAAEKSGIESVRHRLIRNLSKGYRQRLALAGAIVHSPPIIVLDEPSAGLDPNQIFELRALVSELGETHTVIVSSHVMQEIEALADHVLILDQGRIVADGAAASLLGSGGSAAWDVTVSGSSREAIDSALSAFDGTASVISSSDDSPSLRVELIPAGSEETAETEVFDWAVKNGLKLSRLERRTERLESLFRRLTVHDAFEGQAENNGGDGGRDS